MSRTKPLVGDVLWSTLERSDWCGPTIDTPPQASTTEGARGSNRVVMLSKSLCGKGLLKEKLKRSDLEGQMLDSLPNNAAKDRHNAIVFTLKAPV